MDATPKTAGDEAGGAVGYRTGPPARNARPAPGVPAVSLLHAAVGKRP